MASSTRISNCSSQPPLKNPASSPSATPPVTPMTTASAETSSEARPPQMTRLSTSRPAWSVPNGCAALGSSSTDSISTASGLYGAIQGAASPSTTISSTRQPPISPPIPPNVPRMRRITRAPPQAGD